MQALACPETMQTSRTKKSPNRVSNRFGLYCPTPDWQHWQSALNVA
jgi:hypothetical protein